MLCLWKHYLVPDIGDDVANVSRCSLYSILCLWKPYIMFMETLHSTLYRKSRGKSRPMFLLYIAVGINSLRTSRCMTGVHSLSLLSLSLSHTHTQTHTHTHTYIHTYTYTHIMCVCVCVCVCVCIYIYIYIRFITDPWNFRVLFNPPPSSWDEKVAFSDPI